MLSCLTVSHMFDSCSSVKPLLSCLTAACLFDSFSPTDSCLYASQLHTFWTAAHLFDSCSSIWQWLTCLTAAQCSPVFLPPPTPFKCLPCIRPPLFSLWKWRTISLAPPPSLNTHSPQGRYRLRQLDRCHLFRTLDNLPIFVIFREDNREIQVSE